MACILSGTDGLRVFSIAALAASVQHALVRVLICPDKFKGSLSALDVCHAIAAGIRQARPDTEIELLPIADGGEGTVEAFCEALRGEIVQVNVTDPLGRAIQSFYGQLPRGKAVIELAAASGFRLVSADDRDPGSSNTFGTGKLMLAAIANGATELVVGLGGSATNDAGVGMAASLGYRFLDAAGGLVAPLPKEFLRIAAIERPKTLALPPITALCDVSNPLAGPNGATYVFGPQKGVTHPAELDAALAHIAALAKRDLGIDAADLPGAGAAGGMGFGLVTFAGAKLRGGFDVVAEVTGLLQRIGQADLVITAEGCLDAQSISGKGPCGVAQLARKAGKRVAGLPGMTDGHPDLAALFHHILPLVCGGTSKETAMAEPARLLAERAAELMRALPD